MTYYEATGALTRAISFAELARALRRSEGRVLRARLVKDTDRHGRPPPYWPRAVARLARQRAMELLYLAEEMERICPLPPGNWWRLGVNRTRMQRARDKRHGGGASGTGGR
jgi:hypothetical protein